MRLPLGWAVAAYYVNTNWWNKLDPQVRAFLEQTMKDVERAQWELGAKATEDGIACNTGNKDGCKIGTRRVKSNDGNAPDQGRRGDAQEDARRDGAAGLRQALRRGVRRAVQQDRRAGDGRPLRRLSP